MPLRKRIHTTVSDKFPGHSSKKASQVRRAIAAEAARIMSTQSQFNYLLAKQKAIERLGINVRTTMPSNAEVESALRAYQGFYGSQQRIDSLQRKREVAVRAMRSLDPFNPRLAGPVLEGTANENARVTLHVFNDPPDAVVMHLLEKGQTYRSEQRKIRWYNGSYRQVQILVTDVEGIEVELLLFDYLDLRQAPPCPINGRPQKRAPVSELECLLSAP